VVYYDTTESKNISVQDSMIVIKAKVWKGSTEPIQWDIGIENKSVERIIAGLPGLAINKSSVALPTQVIRAGPVIVRKITGGGI
jgi:hypothetical protein